MSDLTQTSNDHLIHALDVLDSLSGDEIAAWESSWALDETLNEEVSTLEAETVAPNVQNYVELGVGDAFDIDPAVLAEWLSDIDVSDPDMDL